MKRYFVMFVVAAMIGGFIAGMIVHGTLSPRGRRNRGGLVLPRSPTSSCA